MFPGFFSHNAAEGQYFRRPELYDRDRPLFKKYVPLCKLVAQAGWEPIPLARTDRPSVHVERFGRSPGTRDLTVFNDTRQRQTVTLRLDETCRRPACELVSGRTFHWQDGLTTFPLDAEDIAAIELK